MAPPKVIEPTIATECDVMCNLQQHLEGSEGSEDDAVPAFFSENPW